MSVKQAVAAILEADAAVAALVGDRVYPRKLEQDATLPAIRYQLISTLPANVLGGEQDAGRSVVQITAAALSEGEATAVSKAASAALRRARQTRVAGVKFDAVTVVDQRDLAAVPKDDGGDSATYAVAFDVSIHHTPME